MLLVTQISSNGSSSHNNRLQAWLPESGSSFHPVQHTLWIHSNSSYWESASRENMPAVVCGYGTQSNFYLLPDSLNCGIEQERVFPLKICGGKLLCISWRSVHWSPQCSRHDYALSSGTVFSLCMSETVMTTGPVTSVREKYQRSSIWGIPGVVP